MSDGSSPQEIEFDATVFKVQTLATDQGVRVALDLPETAIMQMAMLAEAKRQGICLTVSCTVENGLDGNKTRAKRGRA